MQARSAILAQRREEGQADAELIEHLTSCSRDVRRIGLEFIPGGHGDLSSLKEPIFVICSPYVKWE
jgi:hypothetical protein